MHLELGTPKLILATSHLTDLQAALKLQAQLGSFGGQQSNKIKKVSFLSFVVKCETVMS